MALLAEITAIVQQAEREIPDVRDLKELEAKRVRFLGREQGLLTKVMGSLRTVPAAERPQLGAAANAAKARIEQLLEHRHAALATDLVEADLREREDLTLPPRHARIGRLHPVSATIREVSRIFGTMGFETIEGPEIEWDYYNFEALNIPPGHPARDKWSTLWVSNPLGDDPARPMLGRTHTSPMQVRVMEKRRPPIRVVIPGRCYRFEATDATHESVLHQVEGLAIDERLTMADLKGVLFAFARQMFGGDRQIRFRTDYFPFTEPSAELAVSCFVCEGRGRDCKTCGGDGWIETGGCGMVHPDVLRRVNYDPARYQGFAFGCGIERIAMLKSGTPDVRLFAQNDLRFLEAF